MSSGKTDRSGSELMDDDDDDGDKDWNSELERLVRLFVLLCASLGISRMACFLLRQPSDRQTASDNNNNRYAASKIQILLA
jgi:hypothetical protein